mgnify:CR=1 FL=1
MSVFYDGVKIGDFPLHSGGSSPVLFDVPAMLWLNRDRKYIQDTLIAAIPNVSFDAIVGIEFGGALLATLLSEWFQDKNLGFWRKDGTVILSWAKQNIVLIDDVRTTGASFEKAKQCLEMAGHKVVASVALINRSKHGSAA